MSTKRTIVSGDGFHLYKEVFSNDAIYLKLDYEDLYFAACSDNITVAIPARIVDEILDHYKKEQRK